MRPFHWTQELLDKIALRVSELTIEAGGEAMEDVNLNTLRDMLQQIEPYFRPVVNSVNGVVQDISVDPRVAAAIEVLS